MKVELKEIKKSFLEKLSKILPDDCKSDLNICEMIFDNIRLEYLNTTIGIPKDFKFAIDEIFKKNNFTLSKKGDNYSQYSAELGDVYSIYYIYWDKNLFEHYVDGGLVFRTQCKDLEQMYNDIKGLF